MEGGYIADLANDHKFSKVSSVKILCSILNNIINAQICQSLFHQLCFCSEFTKVCTRQSFPLYGIKQGGQNLIISISLVIQISVNLIVNQLPMLGFNPDFSFRVQPHKNYMQ